MRQRLALIIAMAGMGVARGTAAQQAAAAPSSSPARWSIGASVGAGWQSNPSFQPAGDDSVAGVGRASLSRAWAGERSSLVASIHGGGALYRAEVGENRYDFGGSLNGSATLGSRTTFGYGASGRVLYGDVEGVDADGLLLPITRSEHYSGEASLDTRTSERTRLSFSGRYTQYRFDAAQLTDGESVSGNARYSVQVSTRDSLGLGYGLQANLYEGDSRASRIHNFFGGYQRAVSERVSATLDVGGTARVVPPAGFSEASWSLYVNATVSARFEKSTLQGRYREGFTMAPGLGQDRRIRQLGASYGTAIGRRLAFSISGSHTLNIDPAVDGVDYTTDSGSASLRGDLGGGFGLVLLQEYRRRGGTAVSEAVSDYRVTLSLDVARSFQ